jgi:hypothetical protein
MFGVSLDGPQPVIVMEYCSGGILESNQITNIHLISSFDCEQQFLSSRLIRKFGQIVV